MRWRLGPEEEETYLSTRDELVGAVSGWAERTDRWVDELVVETLVDFKWGYSDGRLDRWDEDQLGTYLFDYLPRKVLLDDLEAVVPTARAYLEFLVERERMSPSRADRLDGFLADVEEDFLELGDHPALAGPAKTIVRHMLEEGVDPEDSEAVQAWIEDFNRRPREERDELLPLPDLPPPLPEIELAPRAELEEAAASAPLVRAVDELVGLLGERGRPLTKAGNLRLADGRELCERLGIPFADPWGGEIRSTAELRRLTLVEAMARAGGYVRRYRGRLVPVKSRRGDPPLERIERLTGALLELREWPRPHRWAPFWREHFIPHIRPSVLATLYAAHAAGEAESVEGLGELAWEHLLDHYVLDREEHHDLWRDMLTADLREIILHPAAQLGLLELGDDEARLTPLGAWAIRRQLEAAGEEVPARGEAARVAASPEEFLDLLGGVEPERVGEEVRLWREDRGEGVVDELVAVARESSDHERLLMALAAVEALGQEESRAGMRALLEVPPARPAAAAWLHAHGHTVPPETLRPEEQAPFLARLLAEMLASGGPDELVEAFEGLGPEEEQATALGCLWQVEAPGVEEVLETLGEELPSKALRKQARKALFKRRTARAGSPGR